MERFWRSLGSALGRRWPVVLVVTLALTAVVGVGFSQVEFATGQDSYLDSESQVALDNVEYQDAFGGETVVLLFQMDDGLDVSDLFTEANLAEFERIDAALRAIPEAHAVITPFTSLQWSNGIATGGAGTNALISAAAREPDPAAQELRNADIAMSLARLGAAGDSEYTNPDWVDFLIFANQGFTEAEDGSLTPPDELTIRPSLVPTFPGLDVAVGGVVLTGNATLDELSSGTAAVLEVMESANFDGATVTPAGAPIFLKDINDYLQGGMVTLGLTAFAVMAVILIFLFPVRLRLLPLLSVIVGIIWTFSLLGFIGIDLSLVTISGLPILIGVGIDFAIQVHSRYEEEVTLDRDPDPLGETVANLAPALLAATFAGVAAFLALRVSKVPMIQDFGVLLALGISLLVAFGILLPSTVLGARTWRKRAKHETQWVERLVVWLGSLPPKLVGPLAVIAVILFGLGIAAEGRTEIESDPIRWVDQGSQTVKDIETLEDATGFSSTLGVLIQSANVLDPAVIGVIDQFVRDAEARDDIASTSSLTGTMSKVISVPGTTDLAPTSADLEAAEAVMPPDVRTALLNADLTATQVNLRLAPASLDERAIIVQELEADLAARIAAIEVPAESVLDDGTNDDLPLIRAVPAGLAVVGVALLENLSANRALLTYLSLTVVGLFLVLRHRSLTRAILALVPALLAIGVSSLVVGGLGITLSPLTTVSGPLVVAACSEFAVLILARYLEERERGLDPQAASDLASARTGRAFFTSAATTIGGFATLVISPLPLLRDFGLVVTLNVAIALLAALVAMPPLVVWADKKGLLDIEEKKGAVRLAARASGPQFIVSCVAAVALAIGAVAMYRSAGTDPGAASAIAYDAVALPTTTTTTTTTTTLAPGVTEPPIDPGSFGTDKPDGVVAGALFDFMVAAGIEPNKAVCTAETLLSRVSEADLLASGIATFSDEAVVPVVAAAQDCSVSDEEIDATLSLARGE